MAEKILITGGLGYVGSVAVPHLLREGYDVVVLDTGFFNDAVLFEPPAVRTILKDARDFSDADLRGVEAVIHLAGISNDPFGNLSAEQIYDPTRVYARRIAERCKKHGIRFIFASSCSVYGKGAGAVFDEDSPTNPQTPYSRNKLQIEGDLAALADRTFSPIALRCATAFGLSPRMRFDIVVNMLAGMAFTERKIVLHSDGQAWRPHVQVEDIARAFSSALRSRYQGDGVLILNVGRDDNNLKIIDIAQLVSEACGGVSISFLKRNGNSQTADGLFRTAVVSERGADARNYRVSFKRIHRVFPDFTSQYSVRDGTREMLAAFERIGLTAAQFRDQDFYRLQKIGSLLAEGRIDADLRWKIPTVVG